MSLLDRLRGVGEKLGLVHAPATEAENAEPQHQKVETRTVTVKTLASEIEAADVRALAEAPAELNVPFEKVFDAAGVQAPAHGWTSLRLQELLETEQFQAMGGQAKQAAVLGLLAAEKAPVEDLVRDAVARDQAIDAFGEFVAKKMEGRRLGRERAIAEIEEKIAGLEEERERVRADIADDERHLSEWREKKRHFERRLAWTVSHLMSEPIVSIDPSDDG